MTSVKTGSIAAVFKMKYVIMDTESRISEGGESRREENLGERTHHKF